MAEPIVPDKEEQAFQALDVEKLKADISPDIEKLATEKANEIAETKAKEIADKIVSEKMSDLSKRISGEQPNQDAPAWQKRGEDKPKDWGEVDQRITEKAEKIAQDKFTQLTEEQKKQNEETQKQNTEKWRNKQMLFDGEFHALQAAGVVPEYSKEVQEKLDKGVKLSREDFANDAGLNARREIYETAEQYGVTPSQAYKKYYSQQPQGAKAPVFGAGGFKQQDKELTYEEIQEERKKVFS